MIIFKSSSYADGFKKLKEVVLHPECKKDNKLVFFLTGS
jgi:hypothetical protein